MSFIQIWIILLIISAPFPFWLTHRSMTMKSEYPIGKGNFKNFKDRLEMIKEWEWSKNNPTSLFCYDRSKKSIDGLYHFSVGYLHGSTLIFNEQAMLLGLIDYFRAQMLIRKTIKGIKVKEENSKILTWSELEAKECLDKITEE